MVDRDLYYDATPVNTNIQERGATVAAKIAALFAFNSTSYSAARTQAMTERDLDYAIKAHNLTVAGI